MIIQANFSTPQTGIGYQFFGISGPLGARVTAGLSQPDADSPGLYAADAAAPWAAIGVTWTSDAGLVATEDLSERMALERLAAGAVTGTGGTGGTGGDGTPYSRFYLPLRTVLGDRDPHGLYAYSEADLDSSLDVLYLTGEMPEAYTADSAFITPGVARGDDFALILYRAALLLVQGEDGAGSWKTRALSVSDQGQRKRDLLTHFRLKLSDAENGGGIVFETQQNFFAWLGNACGDTTAEWYLRCPTPLAARALAGAPWG